MLPVNILAMLLIWALLTAANVLSPQFQIRPVAELINAYRDRGAICSMSDAYEEGWIYQGYDFMLWDSLTSILGKGEK